MQNNYRYEADMVIENATIYTVALTIEDIKNGKDTFEIIKNGHVAIKDGKIIAISNQPLSNLIDQFTKTIDGSNKALIPGLIDSHTHALFAGLDLADIDLSTAKSIDDMLLTLKSHALETSSTWIKGREWNELNWNKQVMPTINELDLISKDKPIICMRLCHHICAVNSKALEIAGISKDTTDPDGGKIGRFADGSPNGLFYEMNAISLITRCIPSPTEADCIQSIETIGKYFNSNGITSIIDANLEPYHIRSYFEAQKRNKLTYRADLMLIVNPSTNSDIHDYIEQIEDVAIRTGFGNDTVNINGIKIMLDGIPTPGTAYMREPYEHMPNTAGGLTINENEFIESCKIAGKNNWQIGVHSIGNKAVDVALNGYYEASKNNCFDARNYLIHANFPEEDQLQQIKDLNVGIVTQPTIGHLLGEQAILSNKYANLYVPCKLFFDNGIICAGSSDFPVVPCNPFLGMYSAITRIASDGKVWGDAYKINPRQALIMWTMNSAFFSHKDNIIGSIKVGKRADLVLIDTEILDCDVEAIKDTNVLMTILNGEIIYSKECNV